MHLYIGIEDLLFHFHPNYSMEAEYVCGREQPRRHNQGAESEPHCAKQPTNESSCQLRGDYLHLKTE